jgi:hypothetical protein
MISETFTRSILSVLVSLTDYFVSQVHVFANVMSRGDELNKTEEIKMINSAQFNNLSRVIRYAELELYLYWDSNFFIVDILFEMLNGVSQFRILFFRRSV